MTMKDGLAGNGGPVGQQGTLFGDILSLCSHQANANARSNGLAHVADGKTGGPCAECLSALDRYELDEWVEELLEILPQRCMMADVRSRLTEWKTIYPERTIAWSAPYNAVVVLRRGEEGGS